MTENITNGFAYCGEDISMKVHLESEIYKRVEKNLTLENIQINKEVVFSAIETVNNKTPLITAVIKDVMKLAKR